MSDAHHDLNETQARQGRRGRHVLWILVISLALVVIAFAVIWVSHSDDLAGSGGQEIAPASAAAQFDAPDPAPIQGDEATPTTPPPPGSAEAAQSASPPAQ